MSKVAITIEIDPSSLAGYGDSHLAVAWHLAQANPADIDDPATGDLAERIGREIVRRWLRTVEPELWRHQGRHHYWGALSKLAIWRDGQWVARPGAAAEVAKLREARQGDQCAMSTTAR